MWSLFNFSISFFCLKYTLSTWAVVLVRFHIRFMYSHALLFSEVTSIQYDLYEALINLFLSPAGLL